MENWACLSAWLAIGWGAPCGVWRLHLLSLDLAAIELDCVPGQWRCCGIGWLDLEFSNLGWIAVEVGDRPKIATLLSKYCTKIVGLPWIAETSQSHSSSYYPSANCSARIGRIVHTLQNWGRIIGLPRIAEILQSHSSSLYPSTNCSDGIVGMCHDFLIVLGLHIRRGNLACLWSAGYLDLQSVWKLMDYTKFHGLLFFSGECKRFQDCTCNWIDLYWLFQNYGDPMELD